ncbi:hypothetical protein SAMN05216344_108174 [Polaromonas sp. OV174]|uniref:hypothetical protein n=1 Tax=Polaromonas sp. OV174 TaxID=1855300 RepID=UPI0008E4EDF5|nr:hypothetical protein [Polaromonas sp. OV174]SFC08709.1 hypothetical protein SAMN05216344_108174 [Polaromonas sp. OV174]
MNPLHNRRQFSRALAGGMLLPALSLPATVQAKDTALPVPASLPAAALAASRQGEPLVLLVTLPGCPYCELVRRNYLLPARHSTGLPAWQLDISSRSTPLTGFDGKASTAAAQIKALKANFTPTVLFLGPQGQELAERLVGVAVPDFYGAYLDERLAQARKALLAL